MPNTGALGQPPNTGQTKAGKPGRATNTGAGPHAEHGPDADRRKAGPGAEYGPDAEHGKAGPDAEHGHRARRRTRAGRRTLEGR
eukprot:4517431-Alexandrium_andersonii.AAC.1